MFHLLMYQGAIGPTAANSELSALADPIFSRRNNRYILTEDWDLLAAYYSAPSATASRIRSATFSAIANQQIWPVERDGDVPDDPGWLDLRDYPLYLPEEEEIIVEGSSDLAMGTENSRAVLWLGPRNQFRKNIPRGQLVYCRATGAVAGVAQSWSALGALTFAEQLKGGWYSVVGMQCFDAGTVAARLVFPNPPQYKGRQLRPGCLTQQVIGEKPLPANVLGFGEWGRFHSFEPPQLEIYSDTTGASVQEIRLALVYQGNSGIS